LREAEESALMSGSSIVASDATVPAWRTSEAGQQRRRQPDDARG
jgi:hypothetical protein